MSDKRRGKQKRREEGPEKPTKEEYAVAKFLRFNLPPREGKLVGMTVQYFIASKAVDTLLDSKWGSKAKADALFTTRAGCVDYCDRLLQKGIFHRASRAEKKKDKKKRAEDAGKDEKNKKDKKNKKSKEAEVKSKEEDKENEDSSKEKDEKPKEPEKKEVDKKEEDKKDEEKKKRKKAKLEMHDQQIFKDGDEYYVWIYDPVPLKTFLIGLLLVLGAIGICLFPLWPPEVRLGVYYLSLAAAGFVGFILSLCVIRMILFCIIWCVTFGKHHFWFLPNLTEDVGFFDSFKPLYKHDIMTRESKVEDSKNKEDEKKGEVKGEKDEVDVVSSVDDDKDKQGEDNKSEAEDTEEKAQESASGSENDNGYEIVDPEEVAENEEEINREGETKKTK